MLILKNAFKIQALVKPCKTPVSTTKLGFVNLPIISRVRTRLVLSFISSLTYLETI